MGYYTSFTLLNESSEEWEKIANRIYEIRKNTGRRDFCYGISDNGMRNERNSITEILDDLEEGKTLAKWCDWEDDMKFLSKALPDIVLHLHGVGEDHTDIWQAHFLDGKVQICAAIIPEFDPDKLQ